MIRILQFTGINENNYENLQEMVAHVKLPAVPYCIIHHSKRFCDAALYHIFIQFVFVYFCFISHGPEIFCRSDTHFKYARVFFPMKGVAVIPTNI